MGMDVFGQQATSEVGKYFRRSAWGWHPLWDLVVDLCPWVAGCVASGHTNDGYGLDAEQSAQLAAELSEMLADQTVNAYIEKRNHTLASLPDIECQWCGGTGVRTDEDGQRAGLPEKQWGNGWFGKGVPQDDRRLYQVAVEEVEELVALLVGSGGCEVC